MRFLGRDSSQNKAKTEPKPKRYLLLSSRVVVLGAFAVSLSCDLRLLELFCVSGLHAELWS